MSTSSFAQTLTGIDPGPPVNASQYIGKPEARQISDRPVHHEPFAQSDEYGAFNFNAVLSGLGSTGGYVAIPNAFNENVDGSVEAWVYPTATTSSAPCIVGKGDATNVGFLFGVSWSSNVLYMRFGNTPTVNTGGTTIPLNQWTHVAATWTGGAGNYTVTFYVNGAQSGSPVNNAGTWNVTTDSMTIGSIRAGFGGKTFYGDIDEVRYWQDVRTANEIRDNRFVGVGDGAGANTSSALTSSASYTDMNASYNFNTGGNTSYDYIGGYDGYMRSGALAVYSAYAPRPMPYNFAVLCPFGANDYVSVPDNTAFNLSTGGTVEAWVYPLGQTTTHMIISRGTTGFNFFWGIRASITNKQAIDIGAGTQFQNSDGVTIPINTWTHVAATWVPSGSNFTVTFYVNGKQSGSPVTNATTWNSTAGTLRIGGWHGGTANNFNGYLDEVRVWNTVRPGIEILRTMFVSGRALLPSPNLVGLWNFDGNLLNYSATSGINGTFSTAVPNNCRFSGFLNETSSGALSTTFTAHPTVVNRTVSPNPFPGGFIIKAPIKPILDLQTTYDTITVSGSATLTAIEVFLSAQHTYVSDLSITLKAPNGQTRDLSSGNGGGGDHILTFFIDGSTSVTTSDYLPPWSYAAGPEATMGSFNSTNIQGNWVLSIADGAVGDQGTLMGWGLRFNGAITGTEPISSEIPDRFQLYQNYPNPFNPVTTIKFDIPKSSYVNITLFDMLGREVKKLVNENRTAGTYEIRFDASDLASGTYFYRIDAGSFTDVKKMVLIK
jgi:subtilisin-like proprotein convertase family protein